MKKVIAFLMPLAGAARRGWCFVLRPRTRGAKLLLMNGGELLLVRHTYEPRAYGYGLPGGGLKRSEDPRRGLEREVMEELGLVLGEARFIGIVESDAEYRRDTVHVFTAELARRDAIVPDPVEIAELRWARLERLPPVGPVTARIVQLARRSAVPRIVGIEGDEAG